MNLRRALYFTQRTMGDVSAAGRGRLPQRLVRRPWRRGVGRFLGKRGL